MKDTEKATSFSCNCNRFCNKFDIQVNDWYDAGNHSPSSAININITLFVLSYYRWHGVYLTQLSHRMTWNSFPAQISPSDLIWFAFCGSRRCNYRQLVMKGGEFRGGCPSLTSSLSLDRKVHSSILSHWFQRFSNEKRAKEKKRVQGAGKWFQNWERKN